MIMRANQMYASGVGASSSLVMLPRQPSLPEDDSTLEDEHIPSRARPIMPSSPSLSASLYRGSPMARSSSQKRISQELNQGGLSASPRGLRTPTTSNNHSSLTPGDDYRFPSTSTPTRQIPIRRQSLRITNANYLSNGLSSPPAPISAQRDYFGSDFSIASDATKVPFPSSDSNASISSHLTITNNSSYIDSPSAKRIARHVSLTGAAANSVDSINLIPASPPKNISPISIPPRPAYRHLRYTSELHLNRDKILSAAGSRSDATVDGQVSPRIDSGVGSSLYTNTLGSFTTEDVSSYSNLRSTREAFQSAVAPSKHKLVVVEEGKPNVTYQMGNCIGRGQFGSVYRALNLNSGQMVAVKRIKIGGLVEDEVTQLMGEVDLLKSLSHPSVVKYEGLVRGPEVVSIILEFVENGSLLHTLKAFGNFPEKLVASYVVKILEGLNYLHEMKVVHCDLKAANILTTKNGNVKLSDFGVSLNLQAVKNIKNDAIGTPNWMAPEVIELKGASTASDIWSLGCTVIELLTGKPPYGDMLAMSALWRIVEDDCPPFPDKISEPLRDFLTLCFNKDPTLRPSADRLFEHEWLRNTWNAHLAIRPQDSVPFLKRISKDARANQISILSSSRHPIPQHPMERSSASPPVSLRPNLVSLRASSAPDGWSVQEVALEQAGLGTISSEQTSPLTPSAFPTSSSPPPLSLVDLATRRGSDPSVSFDLLGSHSSLITEKESGVHPMIAATDSSYHDISSVEDHNKPHTFVKITFAKAAVCRICRDAVKKHAVLCEACGLICHASCTKKSMAPCNLRAQLLMYAANEAARGSTDQIRGSSPARPQANIPTISSGLESPSMSPRMFKIPFVRARKMSTMTADVHDTPTVTTVAVPTTPTTPLSLAPPNIGSPSSPTRKRRFSLRPYINRKASPVRVEEVSMARSMSSPRSISGDNTRTDSLGYGSSISSLSSGIPGGATSITKTDTSTSISGSPLPHSTPKKQQHRHSIQISAPATSTPQFLSMEKEKEAGQKAKRRQSAIPQRVTAPIDIIPTSPLSSRVGGVHNKATSSIPRPLASPNKRSRFPSPKSKQDCIVM